MGDKTLTLRLKTLQELALAPTTKRACATGSKRYIKFCKQYNITPFPATELTLCYFAAHLSEHCQYATVGLYLSAIRAEHLNRGLQHPPTGSSTVKIVIARTSKALTAQDQATHQPNTAAATCPGNLGRSFLLSAR